MIIDKHQLAQIGQNLKLDLQCRISEALCEAYPGLWKQDEEKSLTFVKDSFEKLYAEGIREESMLARLIEIGFYSEAHFETDGFGMFYIKVSSNDDLNWCQRARLLDPLLKQKSRIYL